MRLCNTANCYSYYISNTSTERLHISSISNAKMMQSVNSARLSFRTAKGCCQRMAERNGSVIRSTLSLSKQRMNHHRIESELQQSYYTTTTLQCDGSIGTDASPTTAEATTTGGGIGLHNVRDRVMVSARQDALQSRACTVIGAPMTYGQPYVGTDTSPNNLRQIGLIEKLTLLSWNVNDSGNLPFEEYIAKASKEPDVEVKRANALKNFHGIAKNMFEIGIGTHQLAQLVASTLRDAKQFPLILGGDHSIGIGSLAGILEVHPDVGVLWIDAHADINTPYITESGNMHGMPIGFMMDPIMDHTFEHFKSTKQDGAITSGTSSAIPGFEWLQSTFKNRLKPNQLVYVGLRDVDIEERKLITSLGIQAYTMTDIDRKLLCFLVLYIYIIYISQLKTVVVLLFYSQDMGLVMSLTWHCNI